MSKQEDVRKQRIEEAIRGEQEKRRLMREKRRRAKKRKQIALILVCAILVVTISCIVINRVHKNSIDGNSETDLITDSALQQGISDEVSTPLEPVVEFEKKEAKLIAVGDDLVHIGVYQSCLQEDGTHDYTKLFAGIQDYLDEADIKIINQETIFGGEGTELSSYPLFNSPEEIGDAIAEVGFNVVLHATNHAFDMGLDGILNSVEFWRTKHPEVTMIGIYNNAQEQEEIPTVEVNGITIALLNYTYSHNWESFSESAEGHLNILCAYDENTRMIDFNTINTKVLSDIEKAEDIADFTIVFPHWGTEYVFGTTEQQDTFARQMVEAGADLIIGGHPHVIEPVEWVESSNGNRALCYYSLGNFTSTQDTIGGILGGMASLTIVQDETGTHVDEDSIKAIPLVTDYTYPGWTGGAVVNTTYLVNDYTDEQAAAHGLLPRYGITVTKDELLRISEEMFGEYMSLE